MSRVLMCSLTCLSQSDQYEKSIKMLMRQLSRKISLFVHYNTFIWRVSNWHMEINNFENTGVLTSERTREMNRLEQYSRRGNRDGQRCEGIHSVHSLPAWRSLSRSLLSVLTNVITFSRRVFRYFLVWISSHIHFSYLHKLYCLCRGKKSRKKSFR